MGEVSSEKSGGVKRDPDIAHLVQLYEPELEPTAP